MENLPQKFGAPVVLEPKTYKETGLLADGQEISVERPAVLTNAAVGTNQFCSFEPLEFPKKHA